MENVRQRRLADGSSRLYIFRATKANIGTYQCTASSLSGSVTSRQSRLVYRRTRVRPVIVSRPVSAQVKRGETIRLNCKATGYPDPDYSWFKDGGQLSEFHDRFEVESNGTLVITNAQLDDAAHYRCSASNHLGRASSAARIKVNLPIPEGISIYSEGTWPMRLKNNLIFKESQRLHQNQGTLRFLRAKLLSLLVLQEVILILTCLGGTTIAGYFLVVVWQYPMEVSI